MNPVLNITPADLRIKLTEEIVFSFGEHKGSTDKMDDGRWKKREVKYNDDITTILNSIENT